MQLRTVIQYQHNLLPETLHSARACQRTAHDAWEREASDGHGRVQDCSNAQTSITSPHVTPMHVLQ